MCPWKVDQQILENAQWGPRHSIKISACSSFLDILKILSDLCLKQVRQLPPSQVAWHVTKEKTTLVLDSWNLVLTHFGKPVLIPPCFIPGIRLGSHLGKIHSEKGSFSMKQQDKPWRDYTWMTDACNLDPTCDFQNVASYNGTIINRKLDTWWSQQHDANDKMAWTRCQFPSQYHAVVCVNLTSATCKIIIFSNVGIVWTYGEIP